MKIVLTSDLHGRLPEIEACDVLVLAGDICPDHPVGKSARYGLADNGAQYQADWLRDLFVPWLRRQRSDNGVKAVIGIWGNHDFVGEHPRLFEELYIPWILLENSGAEIDGVKFWGTPQVPGLPRWAFYASDDNLRVRAEIIPRDVDILISHGPPYGVADFVDPQYGSVHVGDKALQEALGPRGDLRPALTVCGHIHEQYGKHFMPGEEPVEVWNVSHVNTSYEPVNPPMVLNLDRFEEVPFS